MQTDAPVIQVALSYGIASHSHVTRRYKQTYGMTPHTVRAPALVEAAAGG